MRQFCSPSPHSSSCRAPIPAGLHPSQSHHSGRRKTSEAAAGQSITCSAQINTMAYMLRAQDVITPSTAPPCQPQNMHAPSANTPHLQRAANPPHLVLDASLMLTCSFSQIRLGFNVIQVKETEYSPSHFCMQANPSPTLRVMPELPKKQGAHIPTRT